MAQLVDTIAGQRLMQQVTLPTVQPPLDTAPPHPSDVPARADQMDMDMQGKETDQRDVQMGDNRNGAHRSGSTGPMGDAMQT